MFRVTFVKFQPVISLAVMRMQWKLELYVLQASVYFMFLDMIQSPLEVALDFYSRKASL